MSMLIGQSKRKANRPASSRPSAVEQAELNAYFHISEIETQCGESHFEAFDGKQIQPRVDDVDGAVLLSYL